MSLISVGNESDPCFLELIVTAPDMIPSVRGVAFAVEPVSAPWAFKRPLVTVNPPARSRGWSTAFKIAFFTCCGVYEGLSENTKPATPETKGADMDVPLNVVYPPPRNVLTISTPGAARSTDVCPQFVNTHLVPPPRRSHPVRYPYRSMSLLAATDTMFGRS
jgi:hypothetical protein